jgi:hypothetical protein
VRQKQCPTKLDLSDIAKLKLKKQEQSFNRVLKVKTIQVKRFKWNNGRTLSHHKKVKQWKVKQPPPESLQAQLAITGVCSVNFRSTWSSLELITNEKFQITFTVELKQCIFLKLIWLKTFLYFIVCTHSRLPIALNIDHDKEEATNELIGVSRSRLNNQFQWTWDNQK